MAAFHEIPEPGELVYAPRPSWAPAIFAFATAVTLAGVYIGSFMLAGWTWSLIGGIVMLGALRTMVRTAVRDYYRLPRRQRARAAVLPVEPLRFPPS